MSRAKAALNLQAGWETPLILGALSPRALLPLLFCLSCARAELHSGQSAAEIDRARAACEFGPGAAAGLTVADDQRVGREIPIDTFVVLMLENRSFDHLLGGIQRAYPDADLASPTATNLDAGGLPIARHHLARRCFTDTEHEWVGSHAQWNEGKNDGFVTTNDGPPSDPSGARAMGYYDESDLPILHGLANAYATSDRHFSSLIGPTLPNRMYLYAASSFGVTRGRIIGERVPNIFDALNAAKASWIEYHEGLATSAILPEVFFRHFEQGFHPSLDQFFVDAERGTLPGLALVEGTLAINDGHPPGHIQLTDQLIGRIVEAVQRSPQWPRAAVIILFDEHGGLYDHVPPPAACPPDDHPADEGQWAFDRLGFRVPLVVISPWAKRHHLSHRVTDHTSVTRLVESRFGASALSRRDANADPLSDLFDFDAPPRLTPAEIPALIIDPAEVAACQAEFPPEEASGP